MKILGHDAIINRLLSAPPAQAMLFSGPEGVGKASVARLLAMSFLCQPQSKGSRGDTMPCGTCPTCTRVLAGQHPDVIWLAPLPDKSEINMEQWHDVEARMQYAALEGERKFVVIDGALGNSAANACLKTVEEPPANTHLILITHDVDKVLATIRSRCQQVVFSPLPDAVVASLLREQGVGNVERLARLSQGSLKRADLLAAEALQVADDFFAEWGQGIHPREILKRAAQLSTEESTPAVLACLSAMGRDVLAWQAARTPPAYAVNMNAVESLATRHSPHRITKAVWALEQCAEDLGIKGANKELMLDALFIKLNL